MVKSLKASEIYASQLVHLGYGHPLWYPEPARSGEILIGDVGYIDDGRFIRLFNACRGRGDDVNKNGVPDGFLPLHLPDELLRDQVDIVKPGESLCSDSVRTVKLKINAESPTSPVSASGGYSFSSKGKRGAVAILKDGGVEQRVSRSTAFQQYIYTHHMAWHAFARRRGVHVGVQDIVLVSGFIKTTEWALAAYDNQEAAHDFSLSINASSVFSAESSFSLEEKNHTGLRHRVGPRPQPGSSPTSPPDSPLTEKTFVRPHDQCVFLQYYKCKPRGFGWTTLRKPQNLRPKDMLESVGDECFCAPLDGFVAWARRSFGGCCRDVEIESEELQERSTENPVSALLDYISKSSPADVAVTSHTDLYDLLPSGTKWPTKVSSYLKEKHPKIATDENGAARLDVDALPTPPPLPEKALPPTPSLSPVNRSSPPRHDSTDDADPTLPGAWRHLSRRKTLLPRLDVTPSGLHLAESIDSRLGTPLVRSPAPRAPPSRRPLQRTPSSARSQRSPVPPSR